MTAPNVYVIGTISDLFKIPLDRLPDCLAEMAKVVAEHRRMNMEAGVPLPDVLQWVDDGKEYVTLLVDGAPQASVLLRPQHSDPAAEYTERSGRWLNRHERKAERDFARSHQDKDRL